MSTYVFGWYRLVCPAVIRRANSNQEIKQAVQFANQPEISSAIFTNHNIEQSRQWLKGHSLESPSLAIIRASLSSVFYTGTVTKQKAHKSREAGNRDGIPTRILRWPQTDWTPSTGRSYEQWSVQAARVHLHLGFWTFWTRPRDRHTRDKEQKSIQATAVTRRGDKDNVLTGKHECRKWRAVPDYSSVISWTPLSKPLDN